MAKVNKKQGQQKGIQELKALINKELVTNVPKNIIPASLMRDKPQKRGMISRTQSTSDSSKASDNKDN